MAWWGAAWLALSFGAGLLIVFALGAHAGRLAVGIAVVDAVALAFTTLLAVVIRRSQPRWAVTTVLALLVLALLEQLLSLRFGTSLIIDAALIYICFHAVRGAWRVAALRRGQLTPEQTGAMFD